MSFGQGRIAGATGMSVMLAALIMASTPLHAQDAQNSTLPAAQTTQPAAAPKAPESLTLYFPSGSARVRPQDEAILDQASRLYREGKPIVMIVSGATDATGSADTNLRLSVARADNVVRGLVDRGIPVERFQVVGKGETDPAVKEEAAAQENRRVDITWR